jgi:hypothetical protein
MKDELGYDREHTYVERKRNAIRRPERKGALYGPDK